MKSKKPDYYAWACDFEEFRGEGFLSRSFVKYYFSNKSLKIYTPHNIFFYEKNKFIKLKGKTIKKINHSFLYKYFTPIYGIILLNFFSLIGKKTIYLNFLPLWNIFIFYLLPKKTILGPITGSPDSYTKSFFGSFVRKYLFKIFYKLNLKKLESKKKILFARDFFKNTLEFNFKKKCLFNFQPLSYIFFSNFKKRKIYNKKILIYYRAHNNKNIFFLKTFLTNLKKENFSISVVGDHINFPGVKNYGIVSKKKINKLLKETSYSLISKENALSYFCLECIFHGLKIFHDINNLNLYFNKKMFFRLNKNNMNIMIKKSMKSNFLINKKNYIIKKKKLIEDTKKLNDYMNLC